MKKRLHYAMPRIPLQKLKIDGKQEGTQEEVTHVGAIAKRIRNARIKRQQLSVVEDDHNDTDQARNTETNDQKTKLCREKRQELKRSPPVKDKAADVMDQTTDTLVSKCGSIFHKGTKKKQKQQNRLNADLGEQEMKKLREMDVRLRKALNRKSLRIVLIDSDSSEERKQSSDSDLSCTSVCHTQDDGKKPQIITKDNACAEDIRETEGPHQVAVDVHHGLVDSSSDDEQLEGAVGGFVEELPIEKEAEGGHLNEGAELFFPEEGINIVSSDSSLETFGSQKSSLINGGFIRAKHIEAIEMMKAVKGKVAQTEMKWGEEESSDSDGGWDFETGGMPLLPR